LPLFGFSWTAAMDANAVAPAFINSMVWAMISAVSRSLDTAPN